MQALGIGKLNNPDFNCSSPFIELIGLPPYFQNDVLAYVLSLKTISQDFDANAQDDRPVASEQDPDTFRRRFVAQSMYEFDIGEIVELTREGFRLR